MDEANKKIFDRIINSYKEVSKDDEALLKFLKALSEGEASYATARKYAKRVGNLSTAVLKNFVEAMNSVSDSYDVVREAIRETAYEPASDFVRQVQQYIHEQNSIGLKAKKAPFDLNKASGIAHKVSHAETVEEAERALEAIKTFTESVVNDSIETNARFQSEAGLNPKVRRSGGFRCCKWCAGLEGTFEYGDQPGDFFRQHENCTCVITFWSEKGRRSWTGSRGKRQQVVIPPENTQRASRKELEEIIEKKQSEKRKNDDSLDN